MFFPMWQISHRNISGEQHLNLFFGLQTSWKIVHNGLKPHYLGNIPRKHGVCGQHHGRKATTATLCYRRYILYFWTKWNSHTKWFSLSNFDQDNTKDDIHCPLKGKSVHSITKWSISWLETFYSILPPLPPFFFIEHQSYHLLKATFWGLKDTAAAMSLKSERKRGFVTQWNWRWQKST